MGEFFTADWIPWIITTAFMCGGTYFAIRGDLLRALRIAEDAKTSASEAHGRIDTILLNKEK